MSGDVILSRGYGHVPDSGSSISGLLLSWDGTCIVIEAFASAVFPAVSPVRYPKLLGHHLNVDVNTGRHFQTLKSIYCLLRRGDDVDQSLVSSLLELLTAVLILMNSTKDGNNLLLRRKRNRAAYLRAALLHGLNDLTCGS